MRCILCFVAFLAAGCAPEARQQLSVPVTAASADAASFTAPGDVSVVLEEAWAVLGDLRLEEPAESASRWSLIGSAWAHPGHDMSGDTVGELLGSWTLDLLGEPLALGEASCLEGELATGRVLLSGDPAVLLAGLATLPDGSERPFSFAVSMDSEISGLPLEATLSAAAPPAGLLLEASPAQMLSWVDWSSDDSDGDGLLSLDDDLLYNTVPFGVESTASWTLTLLQP